MPDRGGQGQDALQDSHHRSGPGVAAASFQVEPALEDLADRFDRHRSPDLLPHNALFYTRGQPRRAAETPHLTVQRAFSLTLSSLNVTM
jgi:hypothetical protein